MRISNSMSISWLGFSLMTIFFTFQVPLSNPLLTIFFYLSSTLVESLLTIFFYLSSTLVKSLLTIFFYLSSTLVEFLSNNLLLPFKYLVESLLTIFFYLSSTPLNCCYPSTSFCLMLIIISFVKDDKCGLSHPLFLLTLQN